MVVIFSSPISNKSFMNEKKKACDSFFLDFRPRKQSLANHLSCLPPRCLAWFLSYLSSSDSPNYSWDFLISSDLVTPKQLIVFWPKGNIILQYGGLSSIPLASTPPTFVLFHFCLFFFLIPVSLLHLLEMNQPFFQHFMNTNLVLC